MNNLTEIHESRLIEREKPAFEPEEWRPVVGYEGYYEVSNLGRVRSIPRATGNLIGRKSVGGNILVTYVKAGYHYVKLCINQEKKTGIVHRMVAQAFVPNPDGKLYVDHIDTNKDNNAAMNLRWVTALENSNNSITKQRRDERHYKVMRIDAKGEIVTYESLQEAEKDGFRMQGVSCCCNRTLPLYKGFLWRYVSDEIETTVSEQRALIAERVRRGNAQKRKPVLRIKGTEVKEYQTQKEYVDEGFDAFAVTRCLKGLNKHHKGYEWRYKS